MSDYAIKAENICKSFGKVKVLHNIYFHVKKGEVLGLVGENGSGKSTTMNILGGIFPSDTGKMALFDQEYNPRSPKDAQKEGIAFIHQELNLFENLSISENFFISDFMTIGKTPFLNKKEMRKKTEQCLKAVGLNHSSSTLIEKLSQGERQMVEIAKALASNAKLIIFDEPTTSLTKSEVNRLFKIINSLKEKNISIIYISHVLQDIKEICDAVCVLRDGKVIDQKKIKEVSEAEIIKMMVGRTIDKLFPQRKKVVKEEITLQVNNLSALGLVKNISFQLHKGEVLGFSGLMGSGRSELARIIFGLEEYEKGDIILNQKPIVGNVKKRMNAGLAFLTENRRDEGLILELSITDNTALASREAYTYGILSTINKKILNSNVQNILERTYLNTKNYDLSVKHLSGGNQQKVVIGKWLLTKPSIIILDEPTRGIDVGAKRQIYKMINDLVEAGSSILLISSEIEELMGMSDRIITMNYGCITAVFDKNNFDSNDILEASMKIQEKNDE